MKKAICLILLLILGFNAAYGGLTIVRSDGITLTGADGINYVGTSGITLTGADGFLLSRSNGITLTGADGITLTGADGITLTGADGASYTGPNGITLTGADGITLTGADGITLTGADGITLTGADGTQYRADSVVLYRPSGITLTGADGITLTGADGVSLTGADGAVRTGVNGITLTGADGITLTGADGITLTGADGITLTGADSATGFGTNGVLFELANLNGITLTGADGITLTGADGITLTGADGITLTGVDGITLTGADENTGLQSVDPELAIKLNAATDDSSFNAVVVYHNAVSENDLAQLRQIGILGGTRFRKLPMVYVTGTRAQLIAVSHLPAVRSIYGNRTLTFNTDPYFDHTGIQNVSTDGDLRADNGGIPVTGRGVTVAVLDSGINSQHPDLAGRLAQNVRLADLQSAPAGFTYPLPVENVVNGDPVSGHGTFVGGVIAASGASSGGRFSGVAPGSKLLGLGAGDLNLTHVLGGFDYLLEKRGVYNVGVVNCSFSAETVFDVNDPVNVATRMLTDAGVSVVFSAGNSGSGNGTLNPYAAAPWVIAVGAADRAKRLAGFSSRGSFGSELQHPTLVAPGVSVASLRSTPTMTGTLGVAGADTQRLTPSELPYYTTASGTSFSAPQVAGAIALMLEVNPRLRPAEIKDILSRTATPLPKYFYHEAGAGMLNTYAAVLEAAFPERRLGSFRYPLLQNSLQFVTSAGQITDQAVFPGVASTRPVSIPADTVQASFKISWGLSTNDFGLKLVNSAGHLVGESNYLNIAGLTGRREIVVLRDPAAGDYSAAVQHTGSIGTAQTVTGLLEITRVVYPDLLDLNALSPEYITQVEKSLVTNIMLPKGRKFRPGSSVSRADLAEALVRAGCVPQYMAGSPMFLDVRAADLRAVVESVQAGPNGRLIYDAEPGGRFYPSVNVTRLAAAIAFVKAAGLEGLAGETALPNSVLDGQAIPANWRGHVAVALSRGYLSLDAGNFNPADAITRLQLAAALNRIALD